MLWSKLTRYVGLEESVGKTFFERGFVNINSTNFLYNPDAAVVRRITITSPEGRVDVLTPALYRETHYVNLGLLLGLKRSGGKSGLGDEDSPNGGIGTRYRELMTSCPSTLRGTCHREFIKENEELLKKLRPIPWHMPEWLGGVGMTGFEEPSPLDRKVGRMILLNWSRRQPINLGRKDAPWKTWQRAQASLPKPITVERQFEGTHEWSRVVSTKVVDLLFDSNITIDDLYSELEGNQKVSRAIRHNAKLWTPASYGAISGEGLTDDEIRFRAKYDSADPDPLADQPHAKYTAYLKTSLD